jgi:hypothetical protein
MYTTIIKRRRDGNLEVWHPVPLDQINKDEKFLENVLASSPELMGLRSRGSRIYGKLVALQQVSFTTPVGRAIQPDIVILSENGDFIVVEVKLFANPELRDRRVIAQIIDYVASFSALNEHQLAQIFKKSRIEEAQSWADVIAFLFPDEQEPEDLAQALLSNIQSGNIHVVIACDMVPRGLNEVVRGIATQSTLGFTVLVVEITPYVMDEGDFLEILFVPRIRLESEIVARTAVTIGFKKDEGRPSVSVTTTSIDEIEKNIDAGTKRSLGRLWTTEEMEAAFLESDDPVIRELFEFTKQYSAGGRFMSPGPKKYPVFGFYVTGQRSDQTISTIQIMNYSMEESAAKFAKLYLNQAAMLSSSEVFEEYRNKLNAALGNLIRPDDREPFIPISVIGDNLEELKSVILWFKSRVEH